MTIEEISNYLIKEYKNHKVYFENDFLNGENLIDFLNNANKILIIGSSISRLNNLHFSMNRID